MKANCRGTKKSDHGCNLSETQKSNIRRVCLIFFQYVTLEISTNPQSLHIILKDCLVTKTSFCPFGLSDHGPPSLAVLRKMQMGEFCSHGFAGLKQVMFADYRYPKSCRSYLYFQVLKQNLHRIHREQYRIITVYGFSSSRGRLLLIMLHLYVYGIICKHRCHHTYHIYIYICIHVCVPVKHIDQFRHIFEMIT